MCPFILPLLSAVVVAFFSRLLLASSTGKIYRLFPRSLFAAVDVVLVLEGEISSPTLVLFDVFIF